MSVSIEKVIHHLTDTLHKFRKSCVYVAPHPSCLMILASLSCMKYSDINWTLHILNIVRMQKCHQLCMQDSTESSSKVVITCVTCYLKRLHIIALCTSNICFCVNSYSEILANFSLFDSCTSITSLNWILMKTH